MEGQGKMEKEKTYLKLSDFNLFFVFWVKIEVYPNRHVY